MFIFHRCKYIPCKGVKRELAVVGAHHDESVRVQNLRTFRHERHQVFAHIEVHALEARETRRIEHDSVELEALLDGPAHVFERVPAEKFSRTQVETVQSIVFAALVENFSADVGVRGDRGTAEARMHRETARVAEEVQESRRFAGHRAEAFLHLETHMAHVEEEPRIHRVEQVHMESCIAFAYRTYGSFAGPERNLHRCILERLTRTGKPLLHHDACGIESLGDRIHDRATFPQEFIPEILYLEAVAELVKSKARKTIGSSVHDAESIRHIEQRRSFFKCNF